MKITSRAPTIYTLYILFILHINGKAIIRAEEAIAYPSYPA